MRCDAMRDSGNISRDSGNISRDSGNISRDSGKKWAVQWKALSHLLAHSSLREKQAHHLAVVHSAVRVAVKLLRHQTFPVIQGTFRVIQGTFRVIQGTFRVIKASQLCCQCPFVSSLKKKSNNMLFGPALDVGALFRGVRRIHIGLMSDSMLMLLLLLLMMLLLMLNADDAAAAAAADDADAEC
jgi:hypothetical protein